MVNYLLVIVWIMSAPGSNRMTLFAYTDTVNSLRGFQSTIVCVNIDDDGDDSAT